MKLSATLFLFLACLASAGVFPYPVHKKTLPNGLDVVVIETPEFKDVLSYNTMVMAGSGREEEKGKTGLAHLFEHILFRHRYAAEEGGYDDRMGKLGTDNNAWTWFDVTYYHPLTFTRNLERRGKAGLPGLAELESSRFTALDFSEKTFKTESGAVLGEYRRLASFPSEKMSERLAALMFPNHPYGHTTMGYYEDVADMPNHFEAAKKFYGTYYRPNNCALIVAGDVKAGEIFKAVEPYYKEWKPQPIPTVKQARGSQKEELREHVAWDADVAPLVWVAYRMPAFELGSKNAAAAELLSELLVSPAAPLYKRLRYEKQLASSLGFEEGTRGFESFDPRALVVSAELYKEKHAQKGKAYFSEVAQEIVSELDALKGFSKDPKAKELLKNLKNKYRYDFLAVLSSPGNIAGAFSWYYRFNRSPSALDQLLDSVEALKPEDIDKFAQAWFIPENRAILTLAYEKGK
ncbi:MAG: insulinase family protein [Elusimicrobia bacterium]|nr:insulinase family protein [Elusimicrobiota bacterium]